MNEKIPFKKDIIFKTTIGKITDISVNHNYKIKEDLIEGIFYISGKYKMTEASVIEEDFLYNIPFTIAISERINKDSIDLDIETFNYKIKGDVLEISVNLNMNYDQSEINRIENTFDLEENIVNETFEENNNNFGENNIFTSEVKTKIEENKEDEITLNDTNNVLNFSKNNMGDKYSSYKVVNMCEIGDINNILLKYSITLEDIKSVNNIDELNVGDKIIIPIINNE